MNINLNIGVIIFSYSLVLYICNCLADCVSKKNLTLIIVFYILKDNISYFRYLICHLNGQSPTSFFPNTIQEGTFENENALSVDVLIKEI